MCKTQPSEWSSFLVSKSFLCQLCLWPSGFIVAFLPFEALGLSFKQMGMFTTATKEDVMEAVGWNIIGRDFLIVSLHVFIITMVKV
ncbi:unnamed protein product [Cuscuta campestris]|uniref:Uncharacterized protein n=1 Tax=Cuscuta campestris TaxID=132261 RepID=A0A484L4B4_9ASTE|nr:unnamed protein product [Cuscuta campestris]